MNEDEYNDEDELIYSLVRHKDEVYIRKEVKCFNRSRSFRDKMLSEIKKLKDLNHENIVRVEDVCYDFDKNVIYIYNKYYCKGNLSEKIIEKKKRRENFSLKV